MTCWMTTAVTTAGYYTVVVINALSCRTGDWTTFREPSHRCTHVTPGILLTLESIIAVYCDSVAILGKWQCYIECVPNKLRVIQRCNDARVLYLTCICVVSVVYVTPHRRHECIRGVSGVDTNKNKQMLTNKTPDSTL